MRKIINKICQKNKQVVLIVVGIHILFVLLFFNFFILDKNCSNYYGSPDADNYVKMSYQLIEKGVYGYNSVESNAYVTPSQPIYITSILLLNKIFKVNDLFLIQFFNVILSIGCVILIYYITDLLFKRKICSFVSALLYATYFPNIYYISAALTEIPTIFFGLVTIYTFIIAFKKEKNYLYMIFSVFYAITIMFRPALAPLLIIAFILIWQKYGIKKGTLKLMNFAIGFTIIILPWIIRNYYSLGNPYIFSSHGGNPLLAGTYPFYIEEVDYQQLEDFNMNDVEYAKHRVVNGFKSDPKLYLSWFTLGKFLWLFGGPSKWQTHMAPFYPGLTIIAYMHHFFIFFVAFYGIIKLRKENKSIKMLSYLALLYIFIHLLFIAIDRFGYLIYPIFMIISGYTSYYLYIKLKNKKAELFPKLKFNNG